ncbi:MAG TPA: DUF3592 domain-containing protein [Pirellulales bacterium]|nr:DUF3592 domain-containing protein [Pirellulales bacterium]
MSKSYRTIAAFVAQPNAEFLCKTLQAEGFDARVIDGPAVASEAVPDIHVFEVQVPRDDLENAGPVVAATHTPSSGPRKQFRLRSLLLAMAAACLLVALAHEFGIGPWGRAIWGLVFVFVGVEVIVMMLVMASLGRASWRWTRAPGRIVQSYVQQTGNGDYKTCISYRYQADGIDYDSGTISHIGKAISGMRDSYETYRAEILRFPIGLEVDVFYDPNQPPVAVLERGAKAGDVVACCLFGVVFIIAGVAIVPWF